MNTSFEEKASRIRFVLVRTSHPGNIGSSARAIKNMGFLRLDLVSPKLFPSPQADALASGAQDVLEQAQVYQDVPSALAEADLIFGLSARVRSVPFKVLSPREAVQMVQESGDRFKNIVFLFGSERTGLENHEMGLCSHHVYIPTADYNSLNLAMAVQLLAYEMRLGLMSDGIEQTGGEEKNSYPEDVLASSEELEGFFAHLKETLTQIHFLSPQTQRLMHRLRRLYFKATLERREVNILRGILSATQSHAQKKISLEQDQINQKGP